MSLFYSLILSCVATSGLRMSLLHAVAFSKKLPCFESTNVISLKTQPHAVNAWVKRSSQHSFPHAKIDHFSIGERDIKMFLESIFTMIRK